VDRVRKATQGRGIWGVDRRGDRGVRFEGLLFRDERFLIRLPGHRNLIWNQQTVLAAELAARCPLPCVERVVRQQPDGSEQVLSFGARPGRIAGPGGHTLPRGRRRPAPGGRLHPCEGCGGPVRPPRHRAGG
jgi:hypothetical protein